MTILGWQVVVLLRDWVPCPLVRGRAAESERQFGSFSFLPLSLPPSLPPSFPPSFLPSCHRTAPALPLPLSFPNSLPPSLLFYNTFPLVVWREMCVSVTQSVYTCRLCRCVYVCLKTQTPPTHAASEGSVVVTCSFSLHSYTYSCYTRATFHPYPIVSLPPPLSLSSSLSPHPFHSPLSHPLSFTLSLFPSLPLSPSPSL